MMTDSAPTGQVIDLFAGPGGWSLALARLGLGEVGIELDATACATRRAAGHATIRADVSAFCVTPLAGRVAGLIGSPPCQGYSAAGKRDGLADIALCHRVLGDLAAGVDSRANYAASASDPRSLLVVEPLRFALTAHPTWIALEQVPAVLPLWTHTAELLREIGYSTWTGILNAADYGVPQTRRRAFLIARLDGPAIPPAPTHAEIAEPDDLFGTSRAPWVSMADALGWSAVGDDDPAPTLCGHRTPRWCYGRSATVNTRGNHAGGGSDFPAGRPAWALTKSARTWILRAGNRPSATVRAADQPSATLLFGHALNNVSWTDPDGNTERLSIPEASILQGFPPDYPWQGTRTKVFEQIGNAVPPPLAGAVLAAAMGRIEVAA